MTFMKLRNIVLLALVCVLSITNADPVRPSTEVSNAGSSERKLINSQKRFARDYSNQAQDTTEDFASDLLATTIEPQLSTHGDVSTAQEEAILDERNQLNNSALQVATETSSQSTSVASSSPDSLLYYPTVPVDQPKYRPATNYGPPAGSYRPTAGHGNVKTSNLPFGSSAPKLRQLGFPPISNTRENLGHQVNWAAKIGRSHGSFHEFLSL